MSDDPSPEQVERVVQAIPTDTRRAGDDSRDERGPHLAAGALWGTADDQGHIVANFTAAAELVGWIAAYGDVNVDDVGCLRILYDNCAVLARLLAANEMVLSRRLRELENAGKGGR